MKMGFETYQQEIHETALRLSDRGRGILASDESTGTVGKRLVSIGVENTEENRRQFRELFYTAPGIGQYISGAIMFHETIYQSTSVTGTPVTFVQTLKAENVLTGIKLDKGLKPIPGYPQETFTEGLDGLADRVKAYYEQGARFAKWRSVLKIDPRQGLPSQAAIEQNAAGLAQYAAICQENGLMPIIEPEILIDGNHSIQVSADVAIQVIHQVYNQLYRNRVVLEGTLLKPMMILPGSSCETRATADEIASATLRTMRQVVPPAVPGIMFLSGGMSEEEATVNLNHINLLADSGLREWKAPWSLSFSFGRALQSSALNIWKGNPEKVLLAKEAAVAVAKVNALATLGKYEGPHPSQYRASLYENFRGFRTGEDPTNT